MRIGTRWWDTHGVRCIPGVLGGGVGGVGCSIVCVGGNLARLASSLASHILGALVCVRCVLACLQQ